MLEVADQEVARLGRDEQRCLVNDAQRVGAAAWFYWRRGQAAIQAGIGVCYCAKLARERLDHALEACVSQWQLGSRIYYPAEGTFVPLDVALGLERQRVEVGNIVRRMNEKPVAGDLNADREGEQRPTYRFAVMSADHVRIAVQHLALIGVKAGRGVHLLHRVKQMAASADLQRTAAAQQQLLALDAAQPSEVMGAVGHLRPADERGSCSALSAKHLRIGAGQSAQQAVG